MTRPQLDIHSISMVYTPVCDVTATDTPLDIHSISMVYTPCRLEYVEFQCYITKIK